MLELPHTHGRYQLTERIAQGGMAEIYRAEYRGDGGFVRTLAVKRILSPWTSDPQFVKMLQDEAKLLVKLQHQNIVQVFELGEDEGVFYISMEFVDGVDLRRLLNAFRERGEKIPPKFVYWIISDILRALGFAHGRVGPDGEPLGIVHRDISPQNILIVRHGEVKVADFGIAKGRHRDDQTTAGQLKGKFAYMSPEQALGQAVDSRSDLFSVGILFFEMLTGVRLFDGDSDMDVLRKVQEVVIPSGWEREVAPEIRAILRRCLKKNPDERFQTAEEILTVLSQYVRRINCQIFGFEFAPYIQRMFPEKPDNSAASTSRETVGRVLPPDVPFRKCAEMEILSHSANSKEFAAHRGQSTAFHLDRRHSPDRFQIKHALYNTVLVGFALVLAPQPNWIVIAKAHPVAQTILAQALPPVPVAVSPAVPVSVVVPASPKNAEEVPSAVVKSAKGRLSVQVRPWGYVTIPGVVSHKESPVAVSVAEGNYQVKVFYEPTSQWLLSRATVKSGGTTTCLTSFGGSPRISCK